MNFLQFSKNLVLLNDKKFEKTQNGNENNVFSTVKFEWKGKPYLVFGCVGVLYVFDLESEKIHSRYSIHHTDVEGLCPFQKDNKLYFLSASSRNVHLGEVRLSEEKYYSICEFPSNDWTRSICILKTEREEPFIHFACGSSCGEVFVYKYNFQSERKRELIRYKTDKMILGLYQPLTKPNHLCFVGEFRKIVNFDYRKKIKNGSESPHVIESLETEKDTRVVTYPAHYGSYYNRMTSFISPQTKKEILIVGTSKGCLLVDFDNGKTLQFIQCGECCNVLFFSSRYFVASGILANKQNDNDEKRYGLTVFEINEEVTSIKSIQTISFSFGSEYMSERELSAYALGEIPILWKELENNQQLLTTTKETKQQQQDLSKLTLISSTGKRLFFHTVDLYYFPLKTEQERRSMELEMKTKKVLQKQAEERKTKIEQRKNDENQILNFLAEIRLERYFDGFKNGDIMFEDLPFMEDDEDLEGLIPNKIHRRRFLRKIEELKEENNDDLGPVC